MTTWRSPNSLIVVLPVAFSQVCLKCPRSSCRERIPMIYSAGPASGRVIMTPGPSPTSAGDVPMLRDQVAVITGASSGIGAAVAAELRAAGMRLVLTARRANRLRALADELGESRYVAGDISDPE